MELGFDKKYSIYVRVSEPIETQYVGRDKIKTKAVYNNKDTSAESEIYTIKNIKKY